jgi:hypothetical protein
MARRLPDVIGIGTRRCGSSWLHAVLNSHPEIGKPPSGLHYFSQKSDMGLDWYADQLAPYAARPLLLEFSVSYLYPEYCEASALRMRQAVPDAKLFVCVRNSVARAYSDYLRSIRMNEIAASTSFEQAIADHPVLLDRGRYARLLAPYLNVFPQDRVKVLIFEDMERDPGAFAAELAGFLGISPSFSQDALGRTEPKGKTVRAQWLNRSIRGIKDAVDGVAERAGQSDRWSNWKGRYVNIYERALDLTHRKQDIDRVVATRLAHEFSDDTTFLERLTGKDLRSWRG